MNSSAFYVLLDLDGVIINTEDQYSEYWDCMARRYLPHPEGFAARIKGLTTEMILSHYPQELLPQLRKEYEYFETHMDYSYIRGAEEFLQHMHCCQVPMCVVTGSSKPKLNEVLLSHPEFHELFRFIICGDDIKQGKPDPFCYLLAAERFQTTPEKCVVVEDSVNGLRAGLNAQMHVVGLTTTHPREVVGPLCHMMVPDLSCCNEANLKNLISC